MKITIITVCKNAADTILHTIESVKAQTYKDIEHIFIDGLSTDGTLELLQGQNYISEIDGGIYQAMNKGIRRASGDYILFLNANDKLYDPDTIKNAVNFLKNYPTNLLIGKIITDKGKVVSVDKLSKSYLCTHSIPHQGVFFKTELFSKFGLYSKKYQIVSDYEWFLNYFIKNHRDAVLFGGIISVFDTTGLSSTNLELQKAERKALKKEYFTPWERFIFAVAKIM